MIVRQPPLGKPIVRFAPEPVAKPHQSDQSLFGHARCYFHSLRHHGAEYTRIERYCQQGNILSENFPIDGRKCGQTACNEYTQPG